MEFLKVHKLPNHRKIPPANSFFFAVFPWPMHEMNQNPMLFLIGLYKVGRYDRKHQFRVYMATRWYFNLLDTNVLGHMYMDPWKCHWQCLFRLVYLTPKVRRSDGAHGGDLKGPLGQRKWWERKIRLLPPLRKFNQQLFLVPLIGGRWYIITQ